MQPLKPSDSLAADDSVAVGGVAALLDERRHEIAVGRCLLQAWHERLVGLFRLEAAQQATQTVDDRQFLRIGDELLAAGAGSVDVDGREQSLVRQLAGQAQLHVAGALELLENHLVHLGAGFHQRR